MSNNLDKAADLIINGWCRGNLIKDGKVCALGAIAMVELDLDTRLLVRPEHPEHASFNSPEYLAYRSAMSAHGRYESSVYEHLDDSESVKALADYIRTTEWYANITAGYEKNGVNGFENETEIVFAFNDDARNSYEDVILAFKTAANTLGDGPE